MNDRCLCGEKLEAIQELKKWSHNGKEYVIYNIPVSKCISDDCSSTYTDTDVAIKVSLLQEIMEEESLYKINYHEAVSGISSEDLNENSSNTTKYIDSWNSLSNEEIKQISDIVSAKDENTGWN